MGRADQFLDQLLKLPEGERTRLAMVLLESVESCDPHVHLTDEELEAEIDRRADVASATTGCLDWASLESRIKGKFMP